MRNKILAVAAIAGAVSAPLAAQAQGVVTTGVVRGGPVIISDAEGIAVDQRPAFREYIVRERVPTYTVPERVVVGGHHAFGRVGAVVVRCVGGVAV